MDRLARAHRVGTALGVLFAETGVPVIVVTHDGAFVAANRAAIAQYGWTLEELLEKRIHDLQAHDQSIDPDLDRAFQGDPQPLARRPHQRRDGSILWVVPTAGPITIDGETYIVSVLKDVTAVLEAEQTALDATQASLRDRQLVLSAVGAMLGEREVEPALRVIARTLTQAVEGATSVWLPESEPSRELRMVSSYGLSNADREDLELQRIALDRETFARAAWDEGVGFATSTATARPGSVEGDPQGPAGEQGVIAPLVGRRGPHGLIYARVGVADLERATALATTLGAFGGLVLEAVQLEKRAEFMWSTASEQLGDGIALLDADLRVVRMNNSERRLLGIGDQPITRAPCHEVFTVCDEQPCPHVRARDERKRFVAEVRGQRSGKPLRIEVLPAAPNDAGIAVVHIAHDLTEERAIRSQLVTAERLATIGRVAAGVAHEINNPAAFVTVNLGVLRERFRAGHARTEDVLAMLDESISGMDRIADIVRDLKGFARERSSDVVDLGAIAQSAIRMAAHETRGRARVERVVEAGAFARARGARIAQVVLNLVLNAAQALSPSRVAENRILVHAYRQGDRARIEVVDNGPGVPPSLAEQIFESFFTTREQTGGTGLGLWLARGIVEEDGGTLTLHDAPGGGARFVVDLPAVEAGAG